MYKRQGLFGLFGISSLVLYCGSVMQIISGIMMLDNTLGKLKEILPFAADYFKILEAESTMVYGDVYKRQGNKTALCRAHYAAFGKKSGL